MIVYLIFNKIKFISLTYSNYAFYHQGYEVYTDCEPTMRELTGIYYNL